MLMTPSFFLSFNPIPQSCVIGRMSIQISSSRFIPASGRVKLVNPVRIRWPFFCCHPFQNSENGWVWKKTKMKNPTQIRALKTMVHLTTILNLWSGKIRRKKHKIAALTRTSAVKYKTSMTMNNWGANVSSVIMIQSEHQSNLKNQYDLTIAYKPHVKAKSQCKH